MIGFPSETRVWLASGPTDMRRGFDGLALVVQEVLKRDPHCGHLFVFRGSDDHVGATRLPAGGNRLAPAATHLAAGGCGMTRAENCSALVGLKAQRRPMRHGDAGERVIVVGSARYRQWRCVLALRRT